MRCETAGPPAASASRCTARRASAGGSARRRSSDGGEPASSSATGDRGVEHLGLVAQEVERAQDVLLGGRMQLAQRGDEAVAGAVAGVRVRGVRGVLAPRQPGLGAPRLGLGAPDREQRAHEPPVALAHAQQGAAAGRGGEPVEHRLDLVGGRVAGGDVGVALEREPRRLGVALVARPRLQVALRARRAVDGERHAEPLAERAAERLVPVGGVAQPVVDVQRPDRGRARDAHGEVEQADGVRPARDQHDDGAAGRAAGRPRARAPRDSSSSARRARNSSVDCEKPLSLTSPMCSNSRCGPATSTSERVTSTSPPAARAPTRAARLTSRP